MSCVLDRVTYRYPAAPHPAIHDLSLPLRAGELTWLTGRLGAGCSTVLALLAGHAPRLLHGERQGRVEVLGLDPASADGARHLEGRVAFVSATPAQQLSAIAATVEEEVAFAPANLGWPRARIRERVAAALRALGLEPLAARDPARLSGGEQQRVVLAAMLALEPEVWLLDEPGSALDARGQRLLAALLRAEADRGATVVLASEEADAWLPIADRLVVLARGTVAAEGRPAALLGQELMWTVASGSTRVAELARLAGEGAPWPLTEDEAVARWR